MAHPVNNHQAEEQPLKRREVAADIIALDGPQHVLTVELVVQRGLPEELDEVVEPEVVGWGAIDEMHLTIFEY